MRKWTMMAAIAGLATFGAATWISSPAVHAEDLKAEPKAEVVASKSAKQLAGANNKFGFEMLKRLHVDGENAFISPTSIGMALQMTSRGAKGDTLAQMNDTMHLGELDVGQSNRDLLDAFGGRDDLKLDLANSVWVNPNQILLNREFADKVQAQFDAQIEARDFAKSSTLEEINKWVADRTNQKIPELLKDLSPDGAAVLINAVYFKGSWSLKFDKKLTKEADFTLKGGETKKVQMMSRKDEYDYAQTDDAQWIALDYGDERNMRMWVMLPKEGKSLDSLVKKLDKDSFRKATKWAFGRDGTIKLPRFKMKFRKEIQDELQDMGMKKAFSAGADFSGFEGDERGKLFISKVTHEAIIEVNEEGTEAAAATAVEMERGGEARPFTVNCDRPFFIAIEDKVTGSLLFTGTVYNPGE